MAPLNADLKASSVWKSDGSIFSVFHSLLVRVKKRGVVNLGTVVWIHESAAMTSGSRC